MRPPRRLLAVVVPVAAVIIVVFASAAVEGADPARLSLSGEPREDGSTRIVARVTDAGGKPVAGETVTFRVITAFGWLTVAEVETGSNGLAAVLLPPRPLYGEIRAQAGQGRVRAGLRLASIEPPSLAIRPGRSVLRELSPQPGFISPYPPPQILFVAALLGGIWITYGYLVWLLLGLGRVT